MFRLYTWVISNQLKTAIMKSLKNGYSIITEEYQPADIAVINTCMTETATGMRARSSTLRRRNPKVKIALIGCQAGPGRRT